MFGMIPLGYTQNKVPQPKTTNNLFSLLKPNYGGAAGYGQSSPITGASGKENPGVFWSRDASGGIKQQFGSGGVPNYYGMSLVHPASWNPFTDAFPWQNQAQHTPSDKERQAGYLTGITNVGQARMNYAYPKAVGGFRWNANEQRLKRAQWQKQKDRLEYLRRTGRI